MIITYLLIGVGFMLLTVLSKLLLAKANYESMPMMLQVAELLFVTLAWPIFVVFDVIYIIYMIKEMRAQ